MQDVTFGLSRMILNNEGLVKENETASFIIIR